MQMQKKGQANVAVEMLVIILFVLVVLYPIAQTTVTPGTTLVTVTNQSLDFGTGSVNGSTKTLSNYPLDNGTALSLKWQNGTYNSVTLGNPQNFTYVAATGVITLNSTAATGNITAASRYWNASYVYQPAGYDTNASNRTLLSVITTIILVTGVMLLIAKIRV